MKRTSLDILRCPATHAPFELVQAEGDGEQVERGLLVCRQSASAVPVLAGFPLFPEARFHGREPAAGELRALELELFGDPGTYAAFLDRKWRRPAIDAYAAFQPFNESTQALFPLIEILREALAPGDVILETWCRTGWSGELLAALFPEQRVLSLWEGASDVLGYRGFRHWLPEGRRAPNLELVFHHPDRPLPLADAAVAAVVGLDSLHRYHAPTLVPECLRVCRPDGPLIFPHVHLTNDEPEPWFERGCHKRHGLDYEAAFGALLEGSPRRLFVMSERALFEQDGHTELCHEPDTEHYNALVMLGAHELMGRALERESGPELSPEAYAVLNPLYAVDLHHGSVGVDPGGLEGAIGELLMRHPMYEERLRARCPGELSVTACELLYWCERALPLGAIAERMGRTLEELRPLLEELHRCELIQVRGVSAGMARLNVYYQAQTHRLPPEEESLAALWERSVARHAERPFLISLDQGGFSYAEADELSAVLAGRLLAAGLSAGDALVAHAPPSAELALLFWACARTGVIFCPLDSSWPEARVRSALQDLAPALCVADAERAATLASLAPTLVLGEEPAELLGGMQSFEEWLEGEAAPSPPASSIASSSPAVILFTSGSTGRPKGVQLSQAALMRSAELVAGLYDLGQSDVLLSLGEFHTMSGLRNPLLCSVAAGAASLLPDEASRTHVLGAVELIDQHAVSVLSTVPAFLKRVVQQRERLAPGAMASLRCVLSTAATLPAGVLEDFAGLSAARVHDYYGLTETCGGCIFVDPATGARSEGSIGRPLGVVAQVVGDEGEVLGSGEVGELRIYGENLMLGYHAEPERTREVLRGGWLYTGDLASWSPEGELVLRGRKREVVKDARGDLVYPLEIELVAAREPGVEEVCVCGYSDAQGDERLAAFLRVAPGARPADELVDAVARRIADELGHGHVPGEIRILADFPRGANEKPLKAELVQKHLCDD